MGKAFLIFTTIALGMNIASILHYYGLSSSMSIHMLILATIGCALFPCMWLLDGKSQ